jgi:ribonuclease-3
VTLIHRFPRFLKGQTRTHFRDLEKRLGHRFKNTQLLQQALTHRSIADSSGRNFERLEFLGDAVLSHLVSAHLFTNYPDHSEGELTLKRSALVSKRFLADIGEEMAIHRFLQVNSGVQLDEIKVRRNLVGDAMEALIGAIFLDGGMASADRFIARVLLNREKVADEFINHKGRLIELCHQKDLGNPRFQLLKTKGPEHDKRFVVQVRIGSRRFESAQANNKKAAEQEAAGFALDVLMQELD